jgi:ligand-binding sensor domain-containing protein/serine phosphatase RsbU (regulator of sigma subunit)
VGNKKLIFCIAILIVALVQNANSQFINFKRYGIDEGIIHPSIYTINQDKNGFIWLGTGAGVCFFDGFKFLVPKTTDSIAASYANISFRDKKGMVWFGFDDGSISYVNKARQKKVYENNESPSKVTGICENDNENIIAVTQSGLFYLIDKEKKCRVSSSNSGKMLFSIANVKGNDILLGTDDGLIYATLDQPSLKITNETKVKGLPNTKIQSIIPSHLKNVYWIATEDAGFYRIQINEGKNDFSVINFSNKLKLEESNVQWILEDSQNNLWVCTFGQGIFKLICNADKTNFSDFINYKETDGIGDNFIKNAFEDSEGNIWFGTYSNGITGIVNEAFVFYNFKTDNISNDVFSISSDKEYFWLGGRKTLLKINSKNSSKRETFTPANGLPSDNITSLQTSNGDVLWIGTEKSGIYKMDLKSNSISRFFFSQNSIENKINSIKVGNNFLWVATNGGVLVFNLKTGEKEHYSTDNGLPHNKINDIFIDSRGIVWIATKSNSLISVNSSKTHTISGSGELEFTSITEDKNGNLWACTYGDGIFELKPDTALVYLSEKQGLKSDYCYSLNTDFDGNIWVGHRLAISKINPNTLNISTYGTEIGIKGDCNFNALNIDNNGTVRFGTSDGLVQYNYEKNKQKLPPPSVNLLSLKISDKEYDTEDIIKLPFGIYRIKFDYIGLDYRSPGSVRYQYKLEGWESEWSELTQSTSAFYPRVEDGNFTFLIRAYNAEGIASEPVKVQIFVAAPLWKRWWFILLSIIVVIGVFYLYVKYRERKQIQFQQYLQKLLDERTREVIEQKEEIETKNRDITDSITYAQRIQSSILPSIKKLQETFSGCFIFYQPRDIVSGDFYWFDKITDTKFVIVCGDSTGHGVPGALMSMIGTTLIKDICNRPDVVNPSKILEKLDEEMRQTLNQNIEMEENCDGMDLTACEIDISNLKISVSSAMRPVILYQNGEQIYVEGSKSSIGGNEFAASMKDFENKVFNLSKGDLIYMFSDGYPDQFGGPMGKKFKMVRLRNLLKDIHQLPMEEQYHHIKNTFNLWRDQLDQVDDVLFMGIRI